MKIEKKYAKIVGLALSFPSTIFVGAYLSHILYKNEIVSKPIAVILFLLIICNTLFLIVYYALRNGHKS